MSSIKPPKQRMRCAVYTRKSTEEGLEQEFNSLDAQREAGEAYIASQKHDGWVCLPDRYDDGGYSGGNVERPGLTQLMLDIEAGKIDAVVVYKVGRRGWTTKRWTTRKGRPVEGSPFDKGRIHHLLSNPLYVGRVRHHGEEHPGEQPGIVPAELYERVQRQLRQNGRDGGSECRNKHNALLKGLVFCGPCGTTMGHSFTLRPGGKAYRYYQCTGAVRHGRDSCPSGALPAQQIEDFVMQRVRAVAQDPAVLSATLERARARREQLAGEVEARLEAAKAGLAKVEREIRAAALDPTRAGELAALHGRSREAQDAGGRARRELDDLDAELIGKAEVDDAVSSFDGLWAAMAPSERARLVRLLVRKVE